MEINENEYNKKEDILEKGEELNANYKDEDSIYPMKDIKIDKGFYSIYELKRKYDLSNKKIILDSNFQREDVWKQKQKAELIESVLMGLPLPIFYFNQDKYGNLIVIDGRQRLTALFEFMDGKFSLNKLNILKEYSQTKFSDLTPIMQNKIEDYQIQAHVILPPTPDRIKFDIFDRVNRAGTQLNKQEIRNALYQGNSTEMLNRIAYNNINFEKATGGAFKNDNRMKDRYILLRFLGFFMYFNNKIKDDSGNSYDYKNDMDDMLGKCMDLLNKMDEFEIKELENDIDKGLSNSYFYLGQNGFRVYKTETKKSPINMNLFEMIMYIMYQIPEKNAEIKEFVFDVVEKIISNDDFRDSIDNHRDDINKITTRYKFALKAIEEINKYAENY